MNDDSSPTNNNSRPFTFSNERRGSQSAVDINGGGGGGMG